MWNCLIRGFVVVAHINQMAFSCRLHELPLCALVGILGVIIDTPAIVVVAFCKTPLMLIKGWHRLLQDLVTRHGSCLDAACVPFAGLALAFWPFVVVASALTAFTCSPLVGLYAAVIVYQVRLPCLRYPFLVSLFNWSEIPFVFDICLNLLKRTIRLGQCLVQ